jgi:zinc-binding alcohol dehydrogenase/oxidoreductase
MQALVLTSREEGVVFNPNYTKPQPEIDEILVRVSAAALNHRDVWITQGLYAGIKYPTILGSDGLCQMVETDANGEETLSTQKYIINPNNNWGENEQFQQRDYHILGLPKNGTFTEYLTLKRDRLHLAPSHLSDVEAAALPLAGLTAYRALFTKAGLYPNMLVENTVQNVIAAKRVLISGVGGGVALFTLQFAVAAGAEVYVTSGSEDKIAQALAMGARAGFNYKKPNWQKELVKIHGEMDIVIDSAAGDGFAQLIDTLAFGGKIVFYGGTNGTIHNLMPGKVFWKQISILGSTMGSDTEFEAMLAFVNQHKIKPIVDTVYTLANGLAAFQQMEMGTQFGKIVLTTR